MKTLGFLAVLTALMGLCVVASGQQKSSKGEDRAQLEKQLFQLEQTWLQDEHDKKTDVLNEMWTKEFFDIFPTGQIVTREEMLQRVAGGNPKPGTGAFPDEFKIMAIYGDVVLAVDHTNFRGMDANGNISVTGQARVLRMFVKENGQWKVAGATLISIKSQ